MIATFGNVSGFFFMPTSIFVLGSWAAEPQPDRVGAWEPADSQPLLGETHQTLSGPWHTYSLGKGSAMIRMSSVPQPKEKSPNASNVHD
ncbi:hypothetical protein COCVIDRAFT_38274 [Bipolaris victoriae FI3]|uniref:Secreted protein n=2 Tax=Bipolaris TaxID=33194 RepID=W6YJS6_COCC2|nr:uncharacterized protein COCCADRAFT_32945 [Bipolaris zeicola 26-R-13]XP_014556038.1 hypothetical protein COCVIDRAFT_38274 [Bipolaris victoriae FI3]EUC37845.1 hypothetical protein COCCADRAFT_32945 [Bipolaris zeicola 26-R-13]